MSTASFAGYAAREASGTKSTPLGISAMPWRGSTRTRSNAVHRECGSTLGGACGLLVVANGGKPAAARAIVDIDLGDLPVLPVGDRDYNRRQEARIKIIAQNRSNAEKRKQIELDAWTEMYTDLKISTEVTAPVLSRELKACRHMRPRLGWTQRLI